MQTCKGKTRTGAACRAPAGSGGLCFFHANPDSARALGQIGGRKNRRSVVDLQVPDNMTAADVRNVTAQAIRLLLSGELACTRGKRPGPAVQFVVPRHPDCRSRSAGDNAGRASGTGRKWRFRRTLIQPGHLQADLRLAKPVRS